MASVPAGAARADITDAAVDALRRYGNEDTHYYSHEYVLPLAERLVAIAPGAALPRRHRAERHRGGRDRGAVHAPRDRPPDRDRVHGRLPRGSRHRRRDRRRDERPLVRLPGVDARVRARAVPEPVPHAVHGARRRHGRRHGRLPARPPAAPRRRPARGGRVRDRARDGLGRLRRAARDVLAGAHRPLPRVRLPAVRRRGEDRVRPDRHDVRGASASASSPTSWRSASRWAAA